jgi:hypothetical protein
MGVLFQCKPYLDSLISEGGGGLYSNCGVLKKDVGTDLNEFFKLIIRLIGGWSTIKPNSRILIANNRPAKPAGNMIRALLN